MALIGRFCFFKEITLCDEFERILCLADLVVGSYAPLFCNDSKLLFPRLSKTESWRFALGWLWLELILAPFPDLKLISFPLPNCIAAHVLLVLQRLSAVHAAAVAKVVGLFLDLVVIDHLELLHQINILFRFLILPEYLQVLLIWGCSATFKELKARVFRHLNLLDDFIQVHNSLQSHLPVRLDHLDEVVLRVLVPDPLLDVVDRNLQSPPKLAHAHSSEHSLFEVEDPLLSKKLVHLQLAHV